MLSFATELTGIPDVKRKNTILSIAILLSFSLCMTERTSAVSKQDLESRFQNKTFFIRGFYIQDHLVYDAKANVEDDPPTGSWSIAAVYVEHVKVNKDNFILEGKRAVSVHDPKQNKFVEEVPRKAGRVDIKVEASADALSNSAVDDLVERMFLSRITVQDVPEWWQDLFLGRQRDLKNVTPGTAIPGMEFHGKHIFKVAPGKGGVAPPQVFFKPEPKYVEIARQAKLQGTTVLNAVIDKQGIPEQIQIERAIGIGLDDAAVQAVREWRFSPAMRNGEPVAVAVSIEVAFRLF